jgi:predicted ribonuclease YlaK
LIEDNGAGVKNLINLATNASDARIMARQNQRTAALMTTIVDEPIRIVIPAMVWSELDYQSKSKSSEPTTAFAAREATRMLRDELESEVISNRGVVRSQSLLEARQAGGNYLPKDSKHTNDDHILVCAMTEYEAYKNDNEKLPCSVDAGGVVMVTLDGNLACKAISNGLKVYSPAEFQEYYQKRMHSLRRRAVGRLADSALRR